MPAPRRLTDREIEELVGQVVAGGIGTLDQVITAALFPDGAPEIWGDWPEEAIRVHSRACSLYLGMALRDEFNPQGKTGKHWSLNTLTLAESWDAVVALAPDPTSWWLLPGVTWAMIGRKLSAQLSGRVAAYRFRGLGWQLSGVGNVLPDRRVVVAPCQTCGVGHPPEELLHRRCTSCSRLRLAR